MKPQDASSKPAGPSSKRCRVCGGKGKVPGAETYPPKYTETPPSSVHTHAEEYDRNPALGHASAWVSCSRCEGTGVYPPDTTGERERFYH